MESYKPISHSSMSPHFFLLTCKIALVPYGVLPEQFGVDGGNDLGKRAFILDHPFLSYQTTDVKPTLNGEHFR